jgi:transcriptional regulator with XRE-family HTH domain
LVNAKKLELIEELKQLRTQKGITYQEIADRTEANGEAVSLSTIKMVFSNKYQHDHDYNKVLKPIANVLATPRDEKDLEARILQTRLELKDEIILQLQNRVDAKEKKHKDREEFLMEQLNFCKDQIQFKDSQIKRLNEAIDRKDEMIRKRLIEDEK